MVDVVVVAAVVATAGAAAGAAGRRGKADDDAERGIAEESPADGERSREDDADPTNFGAPLRAAESVGSALLLPRGDEPGDESSSCTALISTFLRAAIFAAARSFSSMKLGS